MKRIDPKTSTLDHKILGMKKKKKRVFKIKPMRFADP